jgi:hypothetical protein
MENMLITLLPILIKCSLRYTRQQAVAAGSTGHLDAGSLYSDLPSAHHRPLDV